jgi:hypothetical protein
MSLNQVYIAIYDKSSGSVQANDDRFKFTKRANCKFFLIPTVVFHGNPVATLLSTAEYMASL